mmetsp:Transcript_3539/g.11013  ORF Transcript_3539/g.11013 Transcript_3539/m.11013 type:complete len:218 (-) Transcript_3539:1367-2020(-)
MHASSSSAAARAGPYCLSRPVMVVLKRVVPSSLVESVRSNTLSIALDGSVVMPSSRAFTRPCMPRCSCRSVRSCASVSPTRHARAALCSLSASSALAPPPRSSCLRRSAVTAATSADTKPQNFATWRAALAALAAFFCESAGSPGWLRAACSFSNHSRPSRGSALVSAESMTRWTLPSHVRTSASARALHWARIVASDAFSSSAARSARCSSTMASA